MPPKSSKKSQVDTPTDESPEKSEVEKVSNGEKSQKKKFVPPKLPEEYASLKKSKDENLVSPEDFDINRVIYSEIKVEDVGNGISGKRINIFYRYDDETYGRLIIDAPEGFSFGVREINDSTTKKLAGYSVSYQLRDMEGWRDDQTKMHEILSQIYESVLDHLYEKRVQLGKKQAWKTRDSVAGSLKNPVYYPLFPKGHEHEGDVDEEKSPSLSIKLLSSKKSKSGEIEISTKFYDAKDSNNVLDPMTLIDQRGRIVPAIVVDCIWLGANSSLMIKCYEADFDAQHYDGRKRLRKPRKVVETKAKSTKDLLDNTDENDGEDNGSQGNNEYDVDQE